jgi:hypothetical protein
MSKSQILLLHTRSSGTPKYSQIPTPAAQTDLLAERLSPKEKDNHAMYGKVSKDFFNSVPVSFQQPAPAHREQNKVQKHHSNNTFHTKPYLEVKTN